MNKKGFSLIEVLFSMIILGIIFVSVVYIHAFMSGHSVRINERVFATQKVMQMTEELRSLVTGSETAQINVLDDYNDGASYSFLLTTNKSITEPDNFLSGNVMFGASWKYVRQVNIIRIPEEKFARKVYVRVYRNSMTDPGQPGEVLAETVSILKTISSDYVPSQSLDVFIICLENVPGWWSSLSTMRPNFEAILQDIQTRCPGLVINAHWISRTAYGRDLEYVPYVNKDDHTDEIAMPYVYFYPGLTRKASDNSDFYYFNPDQISARINVDGTIANPSGYPMADMYNHAVRYPDEERIYAQAVADAQSNGQPVPEISLRMLLEKMNTSPDDYKNALLINLHGELLPLPPMRNYSDAAKDPVNYRNFRIVTHPEKLQYPSGGEVKLRVYPYQSEPNAEYFTNSVNVAGTPTVRRYDNDINFNWAGAVPNASPAVTATRFAVRWKGIIRPRFTENYTFTTFTDDGVRLWLDNNLVIDRWFDQAAASWTATQSLVADQSYNIRMEYYENIGPDRAHLYWQSASQPCEIVPLTTLSTATVYLPNVFLDASNANYFDGNPFNGEITVIGINGSNTGIAYSSGPVTRLAAGTPPTYGVPSWSITNPDASSTLFTFSYTPTANSRSSAGGGGISTAKYLYGSDYIPCPIGTDFSQDLTTTADAPKNSARWIIRFSSGTLRDDRITVETRIGDDLTTGISTHTPTNLSRTYVWLGQTPPETEKYQFLGDPRHCPYLDVKTNKGYNWYFSAVPAADYSGFTEAANGWGVDDCEYDVPRYFQMYRQGLLATQSIWSAMNGFSYYYCGMGGEFGSDMDPLPYAIRFQKTPWSKTNDSTLVYVDEILPYAHSTDINYGKVVAKTDDTWYAKYWLGELCRDSDYTSWQANGNVPTGTGNYYRVSHNNFPDLGRLRDVRTEANGCSSFFNGKPSGQNGPFKHIYDATEKGNLTTTVGLPMSTRFNFPLLAQIEAWRPFTLNYGAGYPDEWNNAVYSAQRTTLSIPAISGRSRIYYTAVNAGSSYNASAVVRMVLGTKTSHVVVSGLSVQSDFGTAQMGKYVVMSMIQSFLDAGLYTGQDKITQIPQLDLTKPSITDNFDNPATVRMEWNAKWRKWDGSKYTEDYSDTYTDAATLIYAVKYSGDQGRTWKYCSDGSATTAGTRDHPGHTTTAVAYDWNVSSLPRGSYVLRVECYRTDYALHYSYDQVQIYINR